MSSTPSHIPVSNVPSKLPSHTPDIIVLHLSQAFEKASLTHRNAYTPRLNSASNVGRSTSSSASIINFDRPNRFQRSKQSDQTAEEVEFHWNLYVNEPKGNSPRFGSLTLIDDGLLCFLRIYEDLKEIINTRIKEFDRVNRCRGGSECRFYPRNQCKFPSTHINQYDKELHFLCPDRFGQGIIKHEYDKCSKYHQLHEYLCYENPELLDNDKLCSFNSTDWKCWRLIRFIRNFLSHFSSRPYQTKEDKPILNSIFQEIQALMFLISWHSFPSSVDSHDKSKNLKLLFTKLNASMWKLAENVKQNEKEWRNCYYALSDWIYEDTIRSSEFNESKSQVDQSVTKKSIKLDFTRRWYKFDDRRVKLDFQKLSESFKQLLFQSLIEYSDTWLTQRGREPLIGRPGKAS
jgi:hypothetical protein